MTDLTVVPMKMCMSNICWEKEIEGNHGTYKVRFDEFTHKGRFHQQYDYSCTCKAFIFQRDKYCKHIQEVIDYELRCGWHQQYHWSNPTEDGKCPLCGDDTVDVMVGI